MTLFTRKLHHGMKDSIKQMCGFEMFDGYCAVIQPGCARHSTGVVLRTSMPIPHSMPGSAPKK